LNCANCGGSPLPLLYHRQRHALYVVEITKIVGVRMVSGGVLSPLCPKTRSPKPVGDQSGKDFDCAIRSLFDRTSLDLKLVRMGRLQDLNLSATSEKGESVRAGATRVKGEVASVLYKLSTL
jgi:hypothetical protein